MKPWNVVLAAITAYKSTDDVRFKRCLSLIEKTKDAGHHIVLIDESQNGIWELLREAGATVYTPSEKGMGSARRESAQKAESYARKNFTNSESIVILLEPEKDDIVRWVPDLIAPIVEGGVKMVYPCRNEESWNSYPQFQAEEEKVANMVYYEVTGLSADPMFGPIVYHSSLSRYFMNCRPFKYGVPDNYVQHVAPMEVIHDKYPVKIVDIGFVYPQEQKAEEEGPKFAEMVKKRIWQQRQLVETYFKVSKTLRLVAPSN